MLAVVGIIVATYFQLPGEVHQVGVVAAHDAAVKSGALAQVLLWTSLFEILSVKAVKETLEGSPRAPGYFGFDPLNLSKTPAAKEKYELNELKNGRLAMLAFSGMITQAVLTGKEFPF
jgi:light-harvesting complex I chlorophyll a/b binding protein 1